MPALGPRAHRRNRPPSSVRSSSRNGPPQWSGRSRDPAEGVVPFRPAAGEHARPLLQLRKKCPDRGCPSSPGSRGWPVKKAQPVPKGQRARSGDINTQSGCKNCARPGVQAVYGGDRVRLPLGDLRRHGEVRGDQRCRTTATSSGLTVSRLHQFSDRFVGSVAVPFGGRAGDEVLNERFLVP